MGGYFVLFFQSPRANIYFTELADRAERANYEGDTTRATTRATHEATRLVRGSRDMEREATEGARSTMLIYIYIYVYICTYMRARNYLVPELPFKTGPNSWRLQKFKDL